MRTIARSCIAAMHRIAAALSEFAQISIDCGTGTSKRLIRLVALAALACGTLALGTHALAEDEEDADIPPKFRDSITPELYFQLRDQHLNLLRGLPADPALREAAIQTRNRQLSVASQQGPAVFSPGAWTAIGPSPIPNGQVTGALAVSGRVTAFAIDTGNTNHVYLGTAQGGVYRSLDGGTNWTQIFDGASTSAIGSLALAPSNSSILFVGTGEANASGDSYAGVGIYRIDNCDTTATLVGPINPLRNDGSSLQNVPIFNGRSISSILVHPTNPSIVFVGVVGGVVGIGGEPALGGTIPPLAARGLVRLTNATSTPASVVAQKLIVTTAGSADVPNTGNRNVDSMFFDPLNPDILTVWVTGNAFGVDGGIYRSINAQAASPVFTQVLATSTDFARGAFAGYNQGTNTVIYAATGEGPSSTGGQLRVSTDGGATWSAAIAGGSGFCGGQCFYNIGLDVRPGATTATSDDLVVLGGNVGTNPAASGSTKLFAKSTDGGATFTESSAGLHADTHFIRIGSANNSVIWHGNDGGIFKTTNGGTTWASLNDNQINSVQFSGLAVHPTDAKWSIGGTQDNGTNMRKADGTWFRVDFGDGGYALIDRNAADTTTMTLYHTYFNQTNNLIGFARILSSACAFDISGGVQGWSFKGRYGGFVDPTARCDGSDTFNGIVLSDAVMFYAPMELGPGSPNTVYFGAGKVYRSANKGDTMVAVSQTSSSPVSTIAVSPQDDNYRIFGRVDGSVFYTTTGANPMTALGSFAGLAKFVARAKFDPSDKNTAYIALGGYFGGTSAAQSHVWKITNLNTTPVITAINNGIPDVPVNAFAVDPVNGNNLFAGTDIGVYGSTDGGATWAPYGTGLPVVAVFGAEIQRTSRTLRIATHGRGMWEIGLPPLTLPDLTVTKTHTGNFAQGQIGAMYTATVHNIGGGDKPAASLVSLADTPPAGLTITAMSGTGWTCAVLPTCTRSDLLAAGQGYPAITIFVTVAGNASSPQINSVAVTTAATESNAGNNTSNDSTTIVAGTSGSLTVTRSGSGSGTVASQDGGVACGAFCTHAYVNGSNVTLTATPAGGSVFTGWLGACTGTGTCIAPISGATTVSATFALSSIGTHILDIDANSQYDRLTDGLMAVRYLFGLTGAAITTGAVGTGATRVDPTQINNYLNDIRPYLDVDGNGVADALTDGLLIIRDLFGATGTTLTQGAIGAGAMRTTPTQVHDYLTTLKP